MSFDCSNTSVFPMITGFDCGLILMIINVSLLHSVLLFFCTKNNVSIPGLFHCKNTLLSVDDPFIIPKPEFLQLYSLSSSVLTLYSLSVVSSQTLLNPLIVNIGSECIIT